MAQSHEKIARDIVVAWLSHTEVPCSFDKAAEAGKAIGEVYKAVLAAVQGAGVPGASVEPPDEPPPEHRRRASRVGRG
jgi:hypothetical protein